MKRKVWLSVIVLLVMGVGGYYYFTTSPTYSVLMIRKALKDHDVVLFEKHVDVDKVFGRLVDDVLSDKISKSAAMQDSSTNNFAAAFSMSLMEKIKPVLVAGLKSSTLRYVETGKLSEDEAPNNSQASQSQNNPGKVSLIGLTSKLDLEEGDSFDYTIEQQGKAATVTVPVRPKGLDTTLQMEFTLINKGGYWQLVQLNNAAELIEAIDQAKVQNKSAQNRKFTEDLKSGTPSSDESNWTVQLASLSSEAKAASFVGRLTAAGFDSYFVNVDGKFRVYSGPVKGRENANKLNDRIQQQENLSGFVVLYAAP